MAIEEVRKFRIDCEDMGQCSERRSIVVEGIDEYAAAVAAQHQGWCVQAPTFPSGDDGGPYLCPEHFADAIAGWEGVGYNPWWLQHHPAKPLASSRQQP